MVIKYQIFLLENHITIVPIVFIPTLIHLKILTPEGTHTFVEYYQPAIGMIALITNHYYPTHIPEISHRHPHRYPIDIP